MKTLNQVRSEIQHQYLRLVWNRVSDQADCQVRNQVWVQVEYQVQYQVSYQVLGRVWEKINGSI